ncbi:MAG TPA: hypothetical protein EYG92_01370 [Lutibacter sp.]|nr:hypothetical protein [Lutibacter sp.]
MNTKAQIALVLLTSLFVISSCRENESNEPTVTCNFVDFRYYHDEQVSIGEMSNEYILLASDTINSDFLITSLIESKDYFDKTYDYEIVKPSNYKYKHIVVKLNTESNCIKITKFMQDLELSSIIDYVHYTMDTEFCTNFLGEPMGEKCVVSYGSNFYVKVNDADDLTDLYDVIQETNTYFEYQNEFMPEWCRLRADKNSKNNALQMANYFYETNKFLAVDYGFYRIPV